MRPGLITFVATGLCVLAAVACNGEAALNEGPLLPELTPFTPAQTDRVHAIRDGIAELRQLSAAETISEGTISREQWQAYNGQGQDSMTEEDLANLEFYNSVWRLMRVIGPDDDLFELTNDAYDSIVAGFYSGSKDTLVVIDGDSGDEFSLDDESTIAHEYVHSFQDGRFGLEALGEEFAPEEDAVSELGTTLDCVVEGDASVASALYMASEHGESWEETNTSMSDEEFAELVETLSAIPRIILEYATFNYTQCETFVSKVYEELGWQGVDALYTDPPTTTEQVMHPEKYLAREPAVVLPDTDMTSLLGKDWSRSEVGAFGEFDVYAYFIAAGFPEADAGRAADGWGGGRIASYRLGAAGDEETGALVHITLSWDTRMDYSDFGFALLLTLSSQGWQLSEADDHVYWWDNTDAGYALVDEDTLQIDLIFASDATSAGIAKAALQGGLALVPEKQ